MNLPTGLAKVFKGYLDLIVLDAPLLWEGMFRKQPDAMDYDLDYPIQCASFGNLKFRKMQ